MQDNPDVDGNQKKIKNDKMMLMSDVEELMQEIKDLTYMNAKANIKNEIEKQGMYEKLRVQEQELNVKIKEINEDFKKAQDE